MRVEIRYVRRKLLAPYVPEDIWKTIKVNNLVLKINKNLNQLNRQKQKRVHALRPR